MTTFWKNTCVRCGCLSKRIAMSKYPGHSSVSFWPRRSLQNHLHLMPSGCSMMHHRCLRIFSVRMPTFNICSCMAVEGRDEQGIKKTIAAFLKILHPDGPPSEAEFAEYVSYAIEGRRRIKEQMNKRKPDDEFAKINLSYVAADGREVIVTCPESQAAQATQQPARHTLGETAAAKKASGKAEAAEPERIAPPPVATVPPPTRAPE